MNWMYLITMLTIIPLTHQAASADWCNIEDEAALCYFQKIGKIKGSIIRKEAHIPPNIASAHFEHKDLLNHKIDRANSAIKVLFIDTKQSNTKEKSYIIKVLPPKKYHEYLEEKQLADDGIITQLNNSIAEYENTHDIKLPRFTEYLGAGHSNKKSAPLYWILMEKAKGLTFNQIKEKLETCSFSEEEAVNIGKEVGTQGGNLINFCYHQKQFYLDLDNFSARNTLYDLESKQISFIDLGKIKLLDTETMSIADRHDLMTLWGIFFPHNLQGDYKVRNDSPSYSKAIIEKNIKNIRLRILTATALLDAYLQTVQEQDPVRMKKVNKAKKKHKNTIKAVFKESTDEMISFLFSPLQMCDS